MKVRYTRNALQDLSDIHTYIAQDNPDAANRVIVRLRESIDLICVFPDLGRRGTIDGTREFVATRLPYIIVYQTTPDEVHILNVFHDARQRG